MLEEIPTLFTIVDGMITIIIVNITSAKAEKRRLKIVIIILN